MASTLRRLVMQTAISSAVHPHQVPICKPYYYLDKTNIMNHRIHAVSFSSKNKIPHVTKGHNEKINSMTNTVTDNKVADSSGSTITAGKKDGKKNEGNVSNATSENTSITNNRILAASFSSQNKIPPITKGPNEKINSTTNTVTDNYKVADSFGSCITAAGEKDSKKNEGNVSHAISENTSITNHRILAASFSSQNKIPPITKGPNEKINSTTNTVTDNYKVADSSGSCITAGEKDGKKNEGNVSPAISENTSITNHRLRAASFSSENKIPHITKGHNGKINSTMNTVTDNKVADSSGSCITAGKKDSKKNEGNVSHATSEKTSDQAIEK